MRHIWADVKRAVCSGSFLLAALGMAACLCPIGKRLCLTAGGARGKRIKGRRRWIAAVGWKHIKIFFKNGAALLAVASLRIYVRTNTLGRTM